MGIWDPHGKCLKACSEEGAGQDGISACWCAILVAPLPQQSKVQVKLLKYILYTKTRMGIYTGREWPILRFPPKAYLFLVCFHHQKAASTWKGSLSYILLYQFQLDQFLSHYRYLKILPDQVSEWILLWLDSKVTLLKGEELEMKNYARTAWALYLKISILK